MHLFKEDIFQEDTILIDTKACYRIVFSVLKFPRFILLNKMKCHNGCSSQGIIQYLLVSTNHTTLLTIKKGKNVCSNQFQLSIVCTDSTIHISSYLFASQAVSASARYCKGVERPIITSVVPSPRRPFLSLVLLRKIAITNKFLANALFMSGKPVSKTQAKSLSH